MPLSNIAYLYLVRLKAHVVLVQELLAVLGIAVGVALLFAAQIASASLNGSIAQISGGVIGKASYQLEARSQQGFKESLLLSVQRLRGVAAAVPVLEQQVVIVGPKGRADVDLLASDPRYVRLTGPLLRHFSGTQLAGQQMLALATPIAKAIGVAPFEDVKVAVSGHVARALVAAELTEADVGQLSHIPVAIAPLAYAQHLLGLPGRVTRIFVQARPRKSREVRAQLARLAGGRINVEPADFDATLFSQAAAPVDQATATFALICALVGFMFAYCSMLLTVDLRRGLVRQQRREGAKRWETIKLLLFDALVMGTIAAAGGLVLGDLLSILLFRTSPGYLAFAFPVGAQRIVTWQSAAISVAVAMLAAGVGVLTPAREIWTQTRGKVRPDRKRFGGWMIAMLSTGVACLAATTLILVAAPQSAILGVVVLMLALLSLLPLLVDAATTVFDRCQRKLGSAATEISVTELHATKTRMRSIAIAATGAIAVFGSVTIQGSHLNLQHGLNRLVRQLSSVADIWVMEPGQQNTLATMSFADAAGARIARLPGVRAVGRYRAGFMEYAGRRVWVLAPPSTASAPIPPSQLLSSGLAQATSRLRAGGWAVLSQALADEHHLRIGQVFTLPAAKPIRLRLAATITNLGWPPGAIILDSGDYVRAWGSADPTAYNVMLRSGASAAQVGREIRNALGDSPAFVVQTEHQREATQIGISKQGLGRLTQIAILALVGGVLATVTSMGATIWQRRRRFARMKADGIATLTLWAALLWESVLLLGSGCLAGAVFGVYGQLLLSHALVAVTGFPVIISLAVPLALGSFATMTAVAAVMIGIPGWRAASVQP